MNSKRGNQTINILLTILFPTNSTDTIKLTLIVYIQKTSSNINLQMFKRNFYVWQVAVVNKLIDYDIGKPQANSDIHSSQCHLTLKPCVAWNGCSTKK